METNGLFGADEWWGKSILYLFLLSCDSTYSCLFAGTVLDISSKSWSTFGESSSFWLFKDEDTLSGNLLESEHVAQKWNNALKRSALPALVFSFKPNLNEGHTLHLNNILIMERQDHFCAQTFCNKGLPRYVHTSDTFNQRKCAVKAWQWKKVNVIVHTVVNVEMELHLLFRLQSPLLPSWGWKKYVHLFYILNRQDSKPIRRPFWEP